MDASGKARAYLGGVGDALKEFDVVRISEIAETLARARDSKKTIFVFGNGGSAATASHFACDLMKMASIGKEKKFRAVCLNDNVPTMMAYANDVSYEEIFAGPLRNMLSEGDVAMGISGSGGSKNVLKAIDYANSAGALTVGICGYGGGRLGQIAKLPLIMQSRDMQVVEDCHMAALHCIARIVTEDY